MSDVEKLHEAIEEWRMSDEPQTELFAAIDAAGFAVVPKVATDRMACAGVETFGLRPNVEAMRRGITAAIAAAPKVLP